MPIAGYGWHPSVSAQGEEMRGVPGEQYPGEAMQQGTHRLAPGWYLTREGRQDTGCPAAAQDVASTRGPAARVSNADPDGYDQCSPMPIGAPPQWRYDVLRCRRPEGPPHRNDQQR